MSDMVKSSSYSDLSPQMAQMNADKNSRIRDLTK